MTAPDLWGGLHPTDVIRDAENEARCALATLVAIEALRREDEYVNLYEGTAPVLLGHFDNLLACARALANHHGDLLDYLRQETDTLLAGWKAERAQRRARAKAEQAKQPECADPHGERLAELEAKEKRLAELEAKEESPSPETGE